MKNLVIVLIIAFTCTTYSQEWIRNEMTEYFENKTIYDISVNKNIVWVCSDVIIRADGSGFKSYGFDSLLTDGHLENFETQSKGNLQFLQIKSNGKTTYLFNGYSTFIKIEDNYVTRIQFPFENYNPGMEMAVDDLGRLWLIDMSHINSEFVNNVYYLDMNKFKKFELDNGRMEPVRIAANKEVYLLMNGYNDEGKPDHQFWIVNENNEIVRHSLKGGGYSLDSDNENVYLSTKGEMAVIKNGDDYSLAEYYNTNSMYVSDNRPAPSSSFSKVVGDWIYRSDITGLRRYNYLTRINEVIPVNYNPEEIVFSDFNLYNDTLLIGKRKSTFGVFSQIPEVKSGIRILNIK